MSEYYRTEYRQAVHIFTPVPRVNEYILKYSHQMGMLPYYFRIACDILLHPNGWEILQMGATVLRDLQTMEQLELSVFPKGHKAAAEMR